MYQSSRHRRPVPTDAHEGSRREFYARHMAGAEAAASGPGPVRRRFLARLWDRITDTRMLLLAAEDVRRGGPAPGADGVSPRDLDWADLIRLARILREALRCGQYRPAPTRRIQIPKRSGGTRTLSIPTVADRVVQRAVLLTLQPLLDPQFRDTALGGRPGRSTAGALATAERLAHDSGTWVWATADVKGAFDAVPHVPLLAALRKRIGESPVLDLLRSLVTTGRDVGIPQGGPLSPLLLNVYLDEVLDRPWAETRPDRPLVRWADDVLILTRTQEEANNALTDLELILCGAGLDLKETSLSIADLGAGESIDWLGFRLSQIGGVLSPAFKPNGWDELTETLRRTHGEDRPTRSAREIVRGWVTAYGPVQPLKRIVERTVASLEEAGVSDAATTNEIYCWWDEAHKRFRPTGTGSTDTVLPDCDVIHPEQDVGSMDGPTAPPVGDILAPYVPDAVTDTAPPDSTDSQVTHSRSGYGRSARVAIVSDRDRCPTREQEFDRRPHSVTRWSGTSRPCAQGCRGPPITPRVSSDGGPDPP